MNSFKARPTAYVRDYNEAAEEARQAYRNDAIMMLILFAILAFYSVAMFKLFVI